MKVGKVIKTVKSPQRRTQRESGEGQRGIPVYIPKKHPQKVEAK